MTESTLEWWKSFETHPDGIESFTDATTVRFMLQNAEEWINADDMEVKVLEGHPVQQQQWMDGSRRYRLLYEQIITELNSWLTARGLQP